MIIIKGSLSPPKTSKSISASSEPNFNEQKEKEEGVNIGSCGTSQMGNINPERSRNYSSLRF